MASSLEAVLGPEPVAVIASAALLANAVGGSAIVLVALLRLPARRLIGPSAAYNLWLLPPLAALAAPFLVLIHQANDPIEAPAAIAPFVPLLTVTWAVGAMAVGLAFVVAQMRFMAEVRAGRAGPAVVGLIYPRIVLPADDAGYTAEERELIRAHERQHVARKDPRAAAFAALIQCLCWFNPLVHLAAYLLRLDQELACDAAVIRSRPNARALYGATLLKTQLAATPLPFGCYWPARGRHPLEVRIGLLKRRKGPAARGDGADVVSATVESIRP